MNKCILLSTPNPHHSELLKTKSGTAKPNYLLNISKKCIPVRLERLGSPILGVSVDRRCPADVYVNGVRTKNDMSPFTSGGGYKNDSKNGSTFSCFLYTKDIV